MDKGFPEIKVDFGHYRDDNFPDLTFFSFSQSTSVQMHRFDIVYFLLRYSKLFPVIFNPFSGLFTINTLTFTTLQEAKDKLLELVNERAAVDMGIQFKEVTKHG